MGTARANADSNDEDALEEDILTYDYDEYSDLVSLRRGLKRAVRVYERTKAHYVAATNEAFRAEAAEQSRASRRLHRPPNREGAAFSKCFAEIEFLWSIVLLPVALRVIAAGLAFFSAAIVVAESTMWVGRAWAYADHASLLSVMLESAMATQNTHKKAGTMTFNSAAISGTLASIFLENVVCLPFALMTGRSIKKL